MTVRCPRCGGCCRVSPAAVDVVAGVTVLCANEHCRFPIAVPAAVRDLGDRAAIAALTRAANEQVDPTAHLVYTIKAGMPERVLAGLLGPPTAARPGTLLYRDIPPGGTTHVAIADGLVEAVRIDAGGTGARPARPGRCLCPPRPGTIDRSRTEAALVEQLVATARDGDAVRIGRLLNARGGLAFMRRVHAAVSARARHRSRELDLAWDGIGDWQRLTA
ncbi:hypothetical protein [Kutzneria sp. NPDC052558]|uniref:hypothetical protein n=1 Tax=Kutzneria sp. NPDC052558 TaxID=3364121 RepID=UPI0037C7B6CA